MTPDRLAEIYPKVTSTIFRRCYALLGQRDDALDAGVGKPRHQQRGRQLYRLASAGQLYVTGRHGQTSTFGTTIVTAPAAATGGSDGSFVWRLVP